MANERIYDMMMQCESADVSAELTASFNQKLKQLRHQHSDSVFCYLRDVVSAATARWLDGWLAGSAGNVSKRLTYLKTFSTTW